MSRKRSHYRPRRVSAPMLVNRGLQSLDIDTQELMLVAAFAGGYATRQDDDFNDSTRVAKWFHDAGAIDVLVSHVLYDSINDDRDGTCLDGARAWNVEFSMPQNA